MPKAAPQHPVILAVDDSADLLALMAKALSGDYQVLTAEDGASGLKVALGKPRPELILLDIEMPGLSGFEVCKMLKANHETADIPVIFLTGKAEKQAEVEGLQLGAVDYVTKPINSAVLKMRVRAQVALSNRRHELEQLVQERTAQLEGTRVELIQRLGRAMQFHESSAVGNRVLRLGHYAKLISHAAGAKPAICDMMFKAAPLHDVGKLGVPSEVLRKKEKLSAPDWEQMKRHPQLGADIIGEQRDPLLQLARQLALTHHEHWDGSGYPKGLKGEAIPWPGRVMAVVDGFESMTTTQFYRDTPLPVERAAAEIVRDAGKRYDPAVVTAFKKALPAMTKVRESFADALGDLINLDFSSPRRAAKAPPAPPEIDFSAPVPESGQAEALEAKLKALEAELAQAKQAAARPAPDPVAEAKLKRETEARLAAEEEAKRLQAALAEAQKEREAKKEAAAPQRPDPALAEMRGKLAAAEQKLAALEQNLGRETEARAAAEGEAKRLRSALAEAQKSAAARDRPDPALAELREKLAAADAERGRLEASLADALQNLATERKLGELKIADTAQERQRLEGAIKREAEMRAEGERRSAEMAAVRKRVDAALDEAREKLVAAEEKLTRETAARVEAQQALEAARAKLEQEGAAHAAQAAAERRRVEAALRGELEKARVEVERRTAEMAEVRKRIDAVLGEARERVAAAERRLSEESAARLAAQQKHEREAAAMSEELKRMRGAAVPEAALAEARKRADAALEIGKREAHALEEARKRLALAEKQLKDEAAARAAAEEKLKRESEARVAAERHAAQVAGAKKAPDPALEEARKRLAAAEEKLREEGAARRVALEIGKRESAARVAAEEKLKRESEARAAAEKQLKEAEEKKEKAAADSGGISQQGLAAARRALGKPKEKAGK